MQASANNVAECERLLAAGVDPRGKATVSYFARWLSSKSLSLLVYHALVVGWSNTSGAGHWSQKLAVGRPTRYSSIRLQLYVFHVQFDVITLHSVHLFNCCQWSYGGYPDLNIWGYEGGPDLNTRNYKAHHDCATGVGINTFVSLILRLRLWVVRLISFIKAKVAKLYEAFFCCSLSNTHVSFRNDWAESTESAFQQVSLFFSKKKIDIETEAAQFLLWCFYV